MAAHVRVRARFADWPYEPDVTQLILLDHQMLPTVDAVRSWVRQAMDSTPHLRAIRTGAMFPVAADAFTEAGFHTIDTLALLETSLPARTTGRRSDTQRLRACHLPDVAALDRRAFGDPWGNDVRSLTAITDATPRHRARIVTDVDEHGERCVGGFAITGQSGVFGYLQRLAVDPSARGRGIARRLVDDSLRWMQRRGATTAMVNTALDNDAALSLYDSVGFRPRTETLRILELSGDDLHRYGAPR